MRFIYGFLFICFFSTLFLDPLCARQPEPADFAFGIKIKIAEPGIIYRLRLPLDVYENIDSSGAILNIQTNDNIKPDKSVSYYLFDLTGLEQIPNELLFKWGKTKDNFSVKVRLEFSNNMTDWHDINTDTTLASFNFSGHTLIKNKISLPLKKTKYIRMHWPQQSGKQTIKEVRAKFPDQTNAMSRQWRSFLSSKNDEKQNIHEYEIKGVFPVSLINLEFPDRNQIFKAVLKSRSDEKSSWRTRHEGLFYNINMNGVYFSNDAIHVGITKDQHWQLSFISENTGFKDGPPKLKIGWTPQDIYFLNQGQAPFKMAFGNYEVEPLDNLVDQLIANLDKNGSEKNQTNDMIKTALPGTIFKLGEKKIKKTAVQWKKWILWTILVLGVFLLGVMAIRLSKQMSA